MNPLPTRADALVASLSVGRAVSTRALKTPFSPRLKFAFASGLLVLAAGLAPTAQAAAGDGAGHHSQHQGMPADGHHRGGQHMGGMHPGGMAMDGMGMGLGMGHGRHAERLLDSVGATAEQKAQIRQIGEAARADVRAQREAGAGLREQARALMTAPEIDAAAVEALRQQMLARHDQTSQRMTRAMVDMGRVLTPDQRLALAEQMNQRRATMKQRRAERMAAPAR